MRGGGSYHGSNPGLRVAAAPRYPLYAVDGVLEINQACAVNTGCFAGDTAGFPVTITQHGSYRLTSDLNVPNENTRGITAAADDVTIDLNGFAIVGPTICVGVVAPVCTPLGSGYGIFASASENNLSVSNGTIRGTGNDCVTLGNFGMIHHVDLEDCGGNGIAGNLGSIIANNTVNSVGGDGILNAQAVIRSNIIRGTAGDGIEASQNSIVESNTILFGGQAGANGLNMDSSTGYLRNVLGGTSGPVTGGIELGVNICSGNTTCP